MDLFLFKLSFYLFKIGYTFGTFVVDQKHYMKYLMSKLTAANVKFVEKRVQNVRTFSAEEKFDCVVNCTGLGALSAANDATMYPIRGQVLRVR